jgi:FkbM family methyltransferase
MLIKLEELVHKYQINFKGILHVGAHECEELDVYEKYINRNKILWIEAMIHKVIECKQKFNNLLIEQAVVSDVEENVKFNISNNGQSSSILELGTHKEKHPGVYYTTCFETRTSLLKNIIKNYNIEFNFINLDIQGAELKALKGMEEYLNQVDYLYTEVNEEHLYINCALIGELDEYLLKFGLYRVEIEMTEYKWGDAFYIRK